MKGLRIGGRLALMKPESAVEGTANGKELGHQALVTVWGKSTLLSVPALGMTSRIDEEVRTLAAAFAADYYLQKDR